MNKEEKTRPGKMNYVVESFFAPIQKFIKLEASSGIFLFVVAILAMTIANSDNLKDLYFSFINTPHMDDHFSTKKLLSFKNL